MRLLVLLAALALAAPAAAADPPTLADLEDEVICPTCQTTLELSNSPVATQMRTFIRERIAAGDSKEEIKAQLVDEFGEGVLAAPTKSGFNLVALAASARRAPGRDRGGHVRGAALRAARGPSRPRPRPPLDPELERRVDDELDHFDD